ncbi:MAG: UvrD-helicase domain-containing protein [Bacteroidia bacterium]|nr:UvrD-helicase domain-containing protein [Bacteroidia bacterium]
MSETELLNLDTEARRAVLDVARSFIVQAPAGAGKTELLVQRYLALLAAVDAPEEIVAITFTRKAAAEMRVRVLGALASVHHDPESVPPHRRVTRTLADAALKRDAVFGWNLERHPARMRIMTIDALNGWLARQLPWRSGLGGQMSVGDHPEDLHLEAARRVLNEEHRDPRFREQLERLLVHLDNRYSDIETRIASLLGVREQWRKVLGDGGAVARETLEAGLRRIVEEHLAALVSVMPAQCQQLPRFAAHAASTLAGAGGIADTHPVLALKDMQLLPDADIRNLERWQALAWLLLTDANTLRSPKGITKNHGFLPGEPVKKEFQDFLEVLGGEDAFLRLLAATRTLPDVCYSDAQWGMLETIIGILLHADDSLHRLFAARGTVDHTEVAAAALNALGDDLHPSDLAMMLEYRIGHILIDEFQDTSAGQFALLERLTEAWTPDDGHSLFLVGDPMQSIYRFREAEVGLFLRTWKEGRIGSVPLQRSRLTKNFRSAPGIVHWVNEVFSRLLPPEDDAENGAVSYASSIPGGMSDPEGPQPGEVVSFFPFYDDDRREEAAFIARTAIEYRKRSTAAPGGDPAVAILVRARAHLAPIAAALREAGQRFRAVEIEALAQTPMVRDLQALTFALLHPADDLSAYAVLRAPWCGASLTALTRIANARVSTTVFDAVHSCLAQGEFDGTDAIALTRCMDVVQKATQRVGRLPLRSLVESCWMELGGPACADEEAIETAEAFFSILESCDEGGGLTDYREMHKRLDQLYAPPDPLADADLQLMTLHKAKGLQFDTVLMPRLDATSRPAQNELILWQHGTRAGAADFLLAPVAERGEGQDPTYTWIRNSNKQRDEHERLRLLYVGTTRAKQRLVLTANLKSKEKNGERVLSAPRAGSFLSDLWPVLERQCREGFDVALASRRNTTALSTGTQPRTPQLLMRFAATWTPPPWPPAVQLPRQERAAAVAEELRSSPFRAGEQARAAGIIVHGLLALLAEHGTAFWNESGTDQRHRIITRQLGDVQLPGGTQESIATAELAIHNTLADERGQWILRRWPGGKQEWRLSAVLDGIVRNVIIDRSFVDDDGTRWIIDYKTALHEGAGRDEFLHRQVEAYTPQLRRYAEIVSALEHRPQRLGLYFPLMSEWREIV